MGDVRGKGLDAIGLASTVLAAFRRAARVEPTLTAVAADLDDVVTAVADEEDFVTVVLAEFHDDSSVTLLNCGHHPPLLVADHSHVLVDTGSPAPPLGLHPEPMPATCRLDEGTRLLFYTDGLVESRDCHGTFFPLEESSEALTTKDLGTALDGLLDQVAEHVGERVNDDLALLLVERQDGGARRIA
jgi:phosphoserine phosphatase RsbU/P